MVSSSVYYLPCPVRLRLFCFFLSHSHDVLDSTLDHKTNGPQFIGSFIGKCCRSDNRRERTKREQKSLNRGQGWVKLDKGAITIGGGETDGEVREGSWCVESNESWELEGRQTGHWCGGKRRGREGRWNESGNETDGRQKQDGGTQTTEETDSCVQTDESNVDTELKTQPGH